MKKTVRSFGHALEGLLHAMKEEANLRRFIIGHVVLVVLGLILGIDILSLLLATIFAGLFVSIELLNTAIERLADTLDDFEKKRNQGHYHLGIKQTKDVAAAGSLVALLIYGITILLILAPYFPSRFTLSI